MKIEFPKFDSGDPRGWILKEEKYFRYYQTQDDLKVDLATMYLEGDALNLFPWINYERTLLGGVKMALHKRNAAQRNSKIQMSTCATSGKPDLFTNTARSLQTELRKSTIGRNTILSGLKDKLKSDVRKQKPRMVYKAMSLALEFEAKANQTRGTKGSI